MFLLVLAVSQAQPAAAQTFSAEPLCLNILNAADHEILASLQTDQYTDDRGEISYHDFVFRLQAGEKREACSTGPFFEGPQLRLVLKTSFPVYSCKTPMGRDITVSSHIDENGDRQITADCPSERQLLLERAK
jgi:hypothetical protein